MVNFYFVIKLYFMMHAFILCHHQLSIGHLTCADPDGGAGVRIPPKIHKNIGFLNNIGLQDPLKITKLPSQHSMFTGPSSTHQRNAIKMAFRWRANDGPLIVVFGSSLSSRTENKRKKTRQSWTPPDKSL